MTHGRTGRPRSRSPQQERARVEHRLARVSELYVHRHTLQEIGDQVGVSIGQVCQDVKELHRRWRETRGGFDEAKEKELAKLDLMEQEAREMWELSKSEESLQVEETRSLEVEDDEDEPQPKRAPKKPPARREELKVTSRKTKTSHNSQTGSVYWWEQQRWCVEQRCKLLGLYVEPKDVGKGDTFLQININGKPQQVTPKELWSILATPPQIEVDEVSQELEGRIRELGPATVTDVPPEGTHG